MNTVVRSTNRFGSALLWCAAVLVVVGGLGCQKDTPTAPEGDEAVAATPAVIAAPEGAEAIATTPTAVPVDMGTVVVTVNGKEIREAELSQRVALRMRQLSGQLANLPPQFAGQVQKQIRQRVLDNLVTERLLNEQVAAANVQVSDADVFAEIEKKGAEQNPPITVADFKARVEAQGGNFEQVKEEFRKGMAYQKIMEGQWGDKIDVTDEDAKAYYDGHPKEFENAEQVRASHILIKPDATDPNADPNEAKTLAKAEADKLLAQVKEGGDFAALATEHSDCPSSARGGDLGFFARGAMVKPFEDVAFTMEPNDISDVVETKFGYHIIKVTDHKDPNAVPFDQAKADIVAKLVNEKKGAISQEFIQSLKDKATIVYPSEATTEPNQPAGTAASESTPG
ncbi:MAG: peptidylprolyl isomerase [Sedimentisphaerales bacterium]|nr:peptidylprolyl isomerase [Sedimentisphaerales bacterium]